MILKEAFRMQNHLYDLSMEAKLFLSQSQNLMSTKEEHLRSRSNPGATDETVEVLKPNEMKVDRVIDLYLDIIAEREKLGKAISKAKSTVDFDMDVAISTNKIKQELSEKLKALTELKSSETKVEGIDYLINSEGNQTPYKYVVRKVSTIDFNRESVKGIIKRLQRETDEISCKVDLINVTLDVDYTSKYDLDDIYRAFEKM